jgi:hypothetical protein
MGGIIETAGLVSGAKRLVTAGAGGFPHSCGVRRSHSAHANAMSACAYVALTTAHRRAFSILGRSTNAQLAIMNKNTNKSASKILVIMIGTESKGFPRCSMSCG